VHVQRVDEVDLGGYSPTQVEAQGDAQLFAEFLVDSNQFVLVEGCNVD